MNEIVIMVGALVYYIDNISQYITHKYIIPTTHMGMESGLSITAQQHLISSGDIL